MTPKQIDQAIEVGKKISLDYKPDGIGGSCDCDVCNDIRPKYDALQTLISTAEEVKALREEVEFWKKRVVIEGEAGEVVGEVIGQQKLQAENKALREEINWLKKQYNEVNNEYKEPINYASTLIRFADQLNVPLWKAVEFGKYFKYKLQADLDLLKKEHKALKGNNLLLEEDNKKLRLSEEDISKLIFDLYPIKPEYQVLLTTSQMVEWCKKIARSICSLQRGKE